MGAFLLRQRVCQGLVVSACSALWLLGGVVLSQTEVPSQPLSTPESTPATSSATAELPQPAAATQPPAPPAVEQAFVGTNQCFVCHRAQTDTWSKTGHAQAFTHLPDPYRSNSECLKCHVTGFGAPSGYVAGSDKDLLMVGCESCHGPGAQHIDAAKRFILASGPAEEAQIEKEIRATIIRSTTDEVCISCHTTQAHGSHPPYQHETLPAPAAGHSANLTNSVTAVKPRSSTAVSQSGYVPGYSVKTCGSCHYDQYLQWRTEKHSALAELLPAKYAADQNCTNCHGITGLASASPATDMHHSLVGVGCESCHGPALAHVRFNVKFIHSPPLGPGLEQEARQSIRQGRPSGACVQCHADQGHKEHPQFEAN